MKILIAGDMKERAPFVSAFANRPDIELCECDPAEGIRGYNESEAVARLEAAIRETSPDAVCVAAERKYRAAISVKALGLGCHVLSDTPVADTPEERAAIAASAERAGKYFMAAHDAVFRPGMLRCISMIYRGTIGALQSVELFVHVPTDFKDGVLNIESDSLAYHRLEKFIGGYLCLFDRITKEELTAASMDESTSEFPEKTAFNLEYGKTGVRACFLQSHGENPHIIEEFARIGVAIPPDSEFIEELRIAGERGAINYFLTKDQELFLIKVKEKYSNAAISYDGNTIQAASHFIDFVSRNIQPFVDARSASGAEEATRICLDLLLEFFYESMKKRTLSFEIPEFWRGLETVRENPVTVRKLVNVEDYRERFTWDFGGRFRVLLMDPPRECLELAKQKYFTSMAIPVLAAVAARHGCVAETDNLNRLLTKPGILTEDEIEKIWGRRQLGCEPSEPELLQKAAAKTADTLPLSRVDLIGFSFQDYHDVYFTLALCREIKKRRDVTIVFGGPVSLDPSRIEGCADFAIKGDGELPLLCLINHIAEGWPVENLPGMYYPPLDKYLCLNLLYDIRIRGVPAYNSELMKIYENDGVTIYPYLFINGCPNRCAFCASCFPGRSGILDVPDVLDQLRQIHQTNGASRFYFLNHLLNTDKKYLNQFLDGLLGLDFKLLWSDSACLYGVDRPLAEKMRRAGCRKITWGLDAATDRLMKLVNKPIRMEGVEAILNIAYNAGIRNEVNVIIGLPHETPDDLDQAMRFMENNSKIISKINYTPYYYAIGSPVYYEPSKHGIIKKGNSFDEIGGLKWDAKMEHNCNAFEKAARFFKDFEKDHNPSEYKMLED